MTIRNAALEDAPAIRSLLDQLGYPAELNFIEDQIRYFSSEGYKLLVCDVDGITVAFASLHCFDMFHTRGKTGRITTICVDETLRGHGVGGAMMIAIEAYFEKAGCDYVEVTTNIRRLETPQFYLKHGYLENSRRFTRKLR